MASKVFAFEETLDFYNREILNKRIQHFPTMTKASEDCIEISEKNYSTISNYITVLKNEFGKRFQDLKRIKKCLLLIENPWHLETTSISQLASILNCNYVDLLDEFIDFKNDANLEVLFKERREKEEYVQFWSIVPPIFKTV